MCASGSWQDGSQCSAAVDWKHVVAGCAAGAMLLGMIVLMVYLAYAHRDRVKGFLQSFFKHEVVLAMTSALEVWGASGHAVPRNVAALAPK